MLLSLTNWLQESTLSVKVNQMEPGEPKQATAINLILTRDHGNSQMAIGSTRKQEKLGRETQKKTQELQRKETGETRKIGPAGTRRTMTVPRLSLPLSWLLLQFQ
jgi:hypothetical protein